MNCGKGQIAGILEVRDCKTEALMGGSLELGSFIAILIYRDFVSLDDELIQLL